MRKKYVLIDSAENLYGIGTIERPEHPLGWMCFPDKAEVEKLIKFMNNAYDDGYEDAKKDAKVILFKVVNDL